jgi:hypothetical protein
VRCSDGYDIDAVSRNYTLKAKGVQDIGQLCTPSHLSLHEVVASRDEHTAVRRDILPRCLDL